MERSNFDKLLQRYLSDQVSEKERIRIEAWLDEVKTDDPTNLELTKEDEEKVFQRITSSIDSSDVLVVSQGQTNLRLWLIGIAATVVLVTVSYVLWSGNAGQSVDKLILNDGTLVWLKGESKLTYHEKQSDGTRHANLTGAALFEVTKDATRPFILTVGDFTLRVLGTSFNVHPVANGLELEVLTGRVNLSSPTDSIGINVEANQRVIYTSQSDPVKTQLVQADISIVTESTDYNMRFENTSLDKILEKIEKKFDVTIEVDNKQVVSCKITADFTDHSLESTLTMISEVLGIDYNISGKTVTVSGSGCK